MLIYHGYIMVSTWKTPWTTCWKYLIALKYCNCSLQYDLYLWSRATTLRRRWTCFYSLILNKTSFRNVYNGERVNSCQCQVLSLVCQHIWWFRSVITPKLFVIFSWELSIISSWDPSPFLTSFEIDFEIELVLIWQIIRSQYYVQNTELQRELRKLATWIQ